MAADRKSTRRIKPVYKHVRTYAYQNRSTTRFIGLELAEGARRDGGERWQNFWNIIESEGISGWYKFIEGTIGSHLDISDTEIELMEEWLIDAREELKDDETLFEEFIENGPEYTT